MLKLNGPKKKTNPWRKIIDLLDKFENVDWFGVVTVCFFSLIIVSGFAFVGAFFFFIPYLPLAVALFAMTMFVALLAVWAVVTDDFLGVSNAPGPKETLHIFVESMNARWERKHTIED